jgi:peptidoglycan-N-acetylglucosamine deacetylase
MQRKIAEVSLLLLLTLINSCKKFEKNGSMREPGIALTLDDDRIDNWFKFLPFFDSTGLKVTFYICRYNRFTPTQKNKLTILKNHGHEIAFHSTNHYNMMDYVYKYHHSMEELMRCEVEAGLRQMNADGFYPTTFAYPYGAHNAIIDKALKRYFKSVRALNGTMDFTKSLAPTEKNDLLFGLGIDRSSNRTDADIINILNSAKNNNNCAVLVAHDINTSNKFSVSLDRLKKIVAYAKTNGLKYYTASEISD